MRGRLPARALLLTMMTGAGPLVPRQGTVADRFRLGPHDVASRLIVGTDLDVWYPTVCARRPTLQQPCAAGAPDSGVFPVLVYALPRSGADAADTAVVGYLVSHGYVVVWTGVRWSAADARVAAGALPFIDSTRSALWTWQGGPESRTAGPWKITLYTPRAGPGTFRVTIPGSSGSGVLVFRLPAGSGRRLAAVVGHLFMDAVLRDWGDPPSGVARRLYALGFGSGPDTGP